MLAALLAQTAAYLPAMDYGQLLLAIKPLIKPFTQ